MEGTLTEERKQVGARLPKSFVAQFSKLAIDRDLSLNDIIEAVLIDWYNKQPESELYGKAESNATTTATPDAIPKNGAQAPAPQGKPAKSAATVTPQKPAAKEGASTGPQQPPAKGAKKKRG